MGKIAKSNNSVNLLREIMAVELSPWTVKTVEALLKSVEDENARQTVISIDDGKIVIDFDRVDRGRLDDFFQFYLPTVLMGKELEVVLRYYGIGRRPQTLLEIAKKHEVSAAYISEVKGRALGKLQDQGSSNNIKLIQQLALTMLFGSEEQVDEAEQRVRDRIFALSGAVQAFYERKKARSRKIPDASHLFDTVYSMPLEDLELSTRTYNCLRRGGLKTLEDLLEKTPSELCGFRNLGWHSLEEITAILYKRGLTLAQEDARG